VFGAVEIGVPVIAGTETALALTWLADLDWSDAALDARVAGGDEIAFCAENLKLELPAPRTVRVAPADIVFEESLMLDLGGVTCRLIHVGGDHSADSVVALVEPDGVLFLGDCLYDDIYAPTRHYSTAKLFPLLDTLARLPAWVYVEGHSPEIMERPAFEQLERQFRIIGGYAIQYPGDAAAVTAAYSRSAGVSVDEDAAEMIRAFTACPVSETTR
jgi:glyoxylase-like metal-dependent hydrolase (beta-lactamase superfamily II)